MPEKEPAICLESNLFISAIEAASTMSTADNRGRTSTAKSGSTKEKSPERKSSSPERKATKKFSEDDFEKKKEAIDPELRKKRNAARLKGLQLDPKEWTKSELMEKLGKFAIYYQDKKTGSGEITLLDGMQVMNEQLSVINELLRRTTEIQRIHLPNCNLTDEYFKTLLDNGLKHLRHLKELNLSNNQLSTKSVKEIVDYYGGLNRNKLMKLNMKGNTTLTFEDGRLLYRIFPYLESLNMFALIELNEQYGGRKRMPMMQLLSEEDKNALKPHDITAKEGMKSMPMDMMSQQSLSSLDSEDVIEEKDEDEVKNNDHPRNHLIPSDKILSLANQTLRMVELGILYDLLTSLRGVEGLDMSGNNLNTKSCHVILDIINVQTRMKVLILSNNPITNHGKDITALERLQCMLQSSKQLIEVSLEGIVGIPMRLVDSIALSCSINRSIYDEKDYYCFNKYISHRIVSLAKKPATTLAKQQQRKREAVASDIALLEKIDEEFMMRNYLPVCHVKMNYSQLDADDDVDNEDEEREERPPAQQGSPGFSLQWIRPMKIENMEKMF